MVPCPGGFIGSGLFPFEIREGDSVGWTWYAPAPGLANGSSVPEGTTYSMSKFFVDDPTTARVELDAAGNLVISPSEAAIPAECVADPAAAPVLEALGAALE